jgi:hypothetical protein
MLLYCARNFLHDLPTVKLSGWLRGVYDDLLESLMEILGARMSSTS